MDDCCKNKAYDVEALAVRQDRVPKAVPAINAVMFFVAAGQVAEASG